LNVVVYYVTDMPRNLATREFETKHICVSSSSKNERERQMQKDKEMTNDSHFSFIIWDSKSKGSYSNIIRALEQDKRVKLYLINESKFLEQDKIKKLNIEFIFRESNGYSASEVISYLKNNVTEKFERTQNLNKYLVEKSVIRREGRIYVPERNYSHLFIIKKHKGKTTGFTFKNAFIDWLEKELKMTDNEFLQEQITLFPTEPEIGDVATF